jgi:hypothetical protein
MQRRISVLALSSALALSASLAATEPKAAPPKTAAPRPIIYDANRQQVPSNPAPRPAAGQAIR